MSTSHARTHLPIVLLIIILPLDVLAQDATPDRADELFQAEAWADAERAYADITASEPANGQAWLRLGYARYHQNEFEGAAEAWMEAGETGFAPQIAFYNAASAYARLGGIDDAFAALNRAVDAGLGQVAQLERDTDLDALRQDPRYEDVLAAVRKNARPCAHDERYRAFDFWVGDWNVVNADGRKLGENRIEPVQNDCVLQEHWTGGMGGTGTSLNYFDPATSSWKQLWVNPFGGHTEYTGSISDGAMRFEGTVVAPDGTTKLSRMTFTPLEDGRVRQYIEQSDDGGRTWSFGFDGYYVRKDASAEK